MQLDQFMHRTFQKEHAVSSAIEKKMPYLIVNKRDDCINRTNHGEAIEMFTSTSSSHSG